MLPSGEEWGWQAKFFIDGFNKSRWAQCDDSVKKALRGHPKLTKLVFCIPFKFPDSRIPGQVSAMTHWEQHRDKWEQLAKKHGMSIEIVLWDEHELLLRLSTPQHRGRCWFWFDTPTMDAAWFQRNVTGALSLAQERYSPDLHFELPVAQHFDALGRRPVFLQRIEVLATKLNKSLATLIQYSQPDGPDNVIDTFRTNFGAIFDTLNSLSPDANLSMDFPKLARQLDFSLELVTTEMRRVWKLLDSTRKPEHNGEKNPPLKKDQHLSEYYLSDLASCIREFQKFCASKDASLANSPAMLISGDAGSGKTHLVCSVAKKRISVGLPTVLLLGEQFDETEPWNQIIRLTGLSCDRDTFLGALSASGEATTSRTLIIIDAINDGPGIRFWCSHLAAMLDYLRSFPYVALVVTVRTAYLDHASLPINKFVHIVHDGFAKISAEATHHFFRHYGLAEPNVPMLDPEFDSPLFLKLICQALKNRNLCALPTDMMGISAIFQFVLDEIDTRLTVKLDCAPSEHLVYKAVHRIAGLMAEHGSEFLSLEVANRELGAIYSSAGYSGSLLQHLISEHVLIRSPSASVTQENIRFAYQRLSDHLIVQSVLARTSKDSLPELFQNNGIFGRKMQDGWLYGVAGWLEALAMQMPETYGLEIDQVVSCSWENEVFRRAFISSLIWRKVTAFSCATEKLIKGLLYGDYWKELFEALICVTARPDHPYNANWLDTVLRPLKMADRDAWWSTYLFGQVENEGNVHRLIIWGWAERKEVRFPDQVIRLATLTLAWCLTSSDRFVRDRATKALVSLLEQRIGILRELIEHFSDVDEHYVQERLYAVAYGCAMLTLQTDELRHLAQDVYNQIFRGDLPPASVLLRDHARGVVERAVHLGLHIDYDPALIKPPYKSKWPKAPPSLASLAKQFKANNYHEEHQGLLCIYNSVTGGDFRHYVINDVSWWSDRRRKNGASSAPNEQFAKLVAQLSPEDAETLTLYAKCLAEISDQPQYECDSAESRRYRQNYVDFVEAKLPRILGCAQYRHFRKQIVPYLKDPRNKQHKRIFSLELFQRLILRRVLELGWTCKRFNEFDRNVDPKGRDCHKAERIGKKYQWIAYDELHARISDNYGLAEDSTPVMSDNEWKQGTWPDSFRNIDPSLLLQESPHDGWGVNQKNWWTPHLYNDWKSAPSPSDWLQKIDDLPAPVDFLQVTGPDKQQWLVLDSYTHWRRDQCIGDFDGRQPDSQEIHYIIRSYLVKRWHLPKVMEWGKKQDWINDRLPSANKYWHRHFQECFWSPHFDWPLDEDWITDLYGDNNDLPHPVLQTTTDFSCGDRGYDCSVEKGFTISMPSRWLAKRMGLRLCGRRGDFVDQDNRIVSFDPSTRETGHSTLLFRRDALQKFIREENMALVWTLLGEKNIYPPDLNSDTWLGRLTILGIYSWEGNDLTGSFRTEFFKR